MVLVDQNAEWWTTSDVAAYLGVRIGTVSSYRGRGQMPAPDGRIGRAYVWRPARIIEWHSARPRPGVGGRPVADIQRPASPLAQLRRRTGLTQEAVAERMGISQARVSKIEQTDVVEIEVATLVKYASAVGGKLRIVVSIGDDEELVLM